VTNCPWKRLQLLISTTDEIPDEAREYIITDWWLKATGGQKKSRKVAVTEVLGLPFGGELTLR